MRLIVFGLISLLFASACGPSRARCRPDTCSGCCTMDDQCVAGTATNQCGIAGNACDVCVGSQTCAAGRCMSGVFITTDGGDTDAGMTGTDAGMTGTDAGTPRDAGMDAGVVVTTGPIVAPSEQ